MSDPEKKQSLALHADEEQGREGLSMPSFISDSSHPGVASVHVILKILILFLYLILPLVTTIFNQLVFVIILAAMDFWIVKNVAGRLLVGLKWGIDFNEDGTEQWKFECKVDERTNSPASDKAFWWTLIIFSLIWIGLLVVNVLKLDITQMTIIGFTAAMLIFNLWAYYKCSKVQKDNFNRFVSQYGADMAGKYMRGSMIANFNPF